MSLTKDAIQLITDTALEATLLVELGRFFEGAFEHGHQVLRHSESPQWVVVSGSARKVCLDLELTIISATDDIQFIVGEH